MPSLESSDLLTLQNALGSEYTIHCSTVAKLYKEKGPNQWGFTGIMGGICCVTNTRTASHYIKIVDLNGSRVVFSQEFYESFIYSQGTGFFHFFETDAWMAGLSFADTGEASKFLEKVHFCRGMMPKVLGKGKKGKKGKKPKKVKPKKEKKVKEKKAKKEKKKKEKKPKKGKKGKFGKMESFSISGPQGFTHVSHAGWDSGKGIFEIRNIPDDWAKLFTKAGINESELQNPQIAPEIHKLLMEEGGVDPAPNAPAPPPPPSGGPPPPGPPPSSNGGPPPTPGGGPPSGGAPPPPPPSAKPSSGNDLSSMLQKKAGSLRSVTDTPAPAQTAPPQEENLVTKLQNRIAQLREALDSDEEEDEEWSD